MHTYKNVEYDLVLRNCRVSVSEGLVDIAVKDGIIATKASGITACGAMDLDLGGKLVTPAFVDLHTHLEKTLTSGIVRNESGTLGEAIANFREFFPKVSEEEFYARAYETAKLAVSNGTLAVRSHITVENEIGLRAIKALLRVKKDLAHLMTLQVVAFPTPDPNGIGEAQLELLRQAIQEGAEVLGGCPTIDPNYRRFIDRLFEMAKELDVPIDFHVDESDAPNVAALEYLAEKTIAAGYQGKVTAGHCCALTAVSEETAERVIDKLKEAAIHVVTLPSCNLFLMGREDRGIVRRGITRVKELLAAGVSVSFASDNVRDPFRPFGNADMLEEALLAAQLLQMGTEPELETILRMGTYNPAAAMNLPKYGLEAGDYADLVVYDAASPGEAIIRQSAKEMVFRRGRLIVTNTKQTKHLWQDEKVKA